MRETIKFESSRLKIKRAYDHIQELEGAFEAFLKSDFCHLAIDHEPDTDTYLVKLVSVGNPPPEIALMIGDIVHNLRTALDYAITKILGKRGNRETIPIGKERDNVKSHSTYRLIKETLPDLAALILDKIQLYDTGHPSIWAACKMDNIDKHSLLIAVTSVQAITGVSLIDETRNNRFESLTLQVGQGGVLQAIHTPGPLKITNRGTPGAQILFGKGQPLEGQPIIESLPKMAELTLQAIETLELFWSPKIKGSSS